MGTAEVAKYVRAALKEAFPGIKFSVRSENYAGGSTIRVRYTDGPTQKAVEGVSFRFQSGSFDGMTDSMSYGKVEIAGQMVYGPSFVFVNRDYSELPVRQALESIANHVGADGETFEGLAPRQSYDGHYELPQILDRSVEYFARCFLTDNVFPLTGPSRDRHQVPVGNNKVACF